MLHEFSFEVVSRGDSAGKGVLHSVFQVREQVQVASLPLKRLMLVELFCVNECDKRSAVSRQHFLSAGHDVVREFGQASAGFADWNNVFRAK
ncbi:hypothetical protein BURKHO8Y_50005 [Burkholderia sp. 8Y]|uniref:hypothetical protein n=1 Tax=Burkholderia sp. 8Y TaxID=2653133 RepID=UPI0012EEF9F9|nr:hypothetical protein BURKHO8Y_50005 [Burkholderia sp. 8Y]